METLRNLYIFHNSQPHQAPRPGVKISPESVTVQFTQRCELDIVHPHLLNRRGKLFQLESNEQLNTTASIALVSLLRYGLCSFLSNRTLLVLSLVCKLAWNIVSPHLNVKFFWEPAFPPQEDMPRTTKVAFDTYYIPIHNSGKIHRITLTRKHISDPSIFACFVDGELVYLAEKQYDQTFNKILFTNPNWTFLYTEFTSPFSTAMFSVRGTRVLVEHNNFADLYKAYNPSQFLVFINDVCTATGKTMKEHHQKALIRAYIVLFLLILFAPVVFLWLVIANFIIRPIRKKLARIDCTVTKYWLHPGATKHICINERLLAKSPIITATTFTSDNEAV